MAQDTNFWNPEKVLKFSNEGSKQQWADFTVLKLLNQLKDEHPGGDLGGCMEEHELFFLD